MQRRDVLKVATATLGGIGLLATQPATSAPRPGASDPERRSLGPYIETADGAQLYVRAWGSGQPIVFISGWALSSDGWAYQMLPLSERGTRCVAYDRRGHGRSTDPGRGYDYDTLADDLASVLDALDLRDVTLVAHSMAGGEAIRYMSRHGAKRIARIALIGTTLPFLSKTDDNPDGIDPAMFEQVRASVFTQGLPTVLQANLRPFVVPATPDATLDWVRNMMLQCSLKAAIDCNRALTSTDFRRELPEVALPTLLVHGDKDLSAPLPLTAKRTAQLLPRATLKVYEGAPHGLMLTHAARLNRDLSEFIGA